MLRGKKKRFADTFILNFSQIEAAKAAGSKPGQERAFAQKMMDDPDVALYVTQALASAESSPRPSQLRVLDEMAAVGFASLGDALELETSGEKKGQLKAVNLSKIDPRAISQFTVRQHQHGTDITVKTHPKVDTLKTLAQTNGLLADDGAPAPRVTINIGGGQVQINNGGGQ